MEFFYRLQTLGATFTFLSVAVVLVLNPLITECATGNDGSLLTGLEIGTLSCKVAITGTLLNPINFKSRFEAVSALLSLFDLQEKINNQVEFIASTSGGSGSGLPPYVTDSEDNLGPISMQVLLKNVIQDSCSYINWTLSDFFYPGYNCGALTQQSFNCSREAAQLLQLKLGLWMANSNAYNNLKEFNCYEQRRCSRIGRSDWVAGLNLNVSDTADAEVQRYLDCII